MVDPPSACSAKSLNFTDFFILTSPLTQSIFKLKPDGEDDNNDENDDDDNYRCNSVNFQYQIQNMSNVPFSPTILENPLFN